jgi:hypothetical protein
MERHAQPTAARFSQPYTGTVIENRDDVRTQAPRTLRQDDPLLGEQTARLVDQLYRLNAPMH